MKLMWTGWREKYQRKDNPPPKLFQIQKKEKKIRIFSPNHKHLHSIVKFHTWNFAVLTLYNIQEGSTWPMHNLIYEINSILWALAVELSITTCFSNLGLLRQGFEHWNLQNARRMLYKRLCQVRGEKTERE